MNPIVVTKAGNPNVQPDKMMTLMQRRAAKRAAAQLVEIAVADHDVANLNLSSGKNSVSDQSGSQDIDCGKDD